MVRDPVRTYVRFSFRLTALPARWYNPIGKEVNIVDKMTLVQKLTAETIKKYPLERLEEIYGCTGGKLMASVFNDIYRHTNLPDSPTVDATPLPVFIEDIPRP